MGYNTGTMLPNPPGHPTAVVAAVEALPFGAAITDSHGTITWANAAYAQLSGCSPDQLLGQSAGTFAWDELLHATPSAEPWRGQAVCKRRTGETYSAEHSITALRGPAEQVMGFWITKRDTTGLKRSAGVMCEAEANLTALIESTEDIVWSVDLNYRLVTFNRALHTAFERSFGVLASVGMGPDDLLPPERAALFPPLYERALSEGPFRADYLLLDGRTLELSISPIRQNGQAVGVSVFGKDITERKQAEDTLREAEAKYRNIFEGVLEGIYRTTLQGKSLAANPALAKILGYDSAEELVSTITDTTHQLWIDPAERTRCVQLLEDHQLVRGFECQVRRKDGTALWVSISLRKVYSDEQTAYYEGVIGDINERKQTQDALRKSEETFAKSFLSSPAIVSLCDLTESGRFVDVNEAFELTNGYRREEVIGRTALELGLWADLNEFSKSVEQFVADGRLRNFEHHFRKKSGDIGVGLTSVEVVQVGGKPIAISTTIDITERKRMQDALRQSEETFQKAFLSSPAATILFRFDGEVRPIVAVNEAFEHATGFSREEVIGRTSAELGLWANPHDLAQFINRLRTSGRIRNFEFPCRTQSGAIRIALASAESVEIGTTPCAIVTVIDVTEQREAQKAIQQANEALSKAEAHHRLMFNSVSDAIFVHTLGEDGLPSHYLEVNDSACRLLGHTRRELLRMRVFDVIAPEERPNVAAKVERLMHDGYLIWEGPLVAKHGGRIPVEVNTHVFDVVGSPMFISSVRDISERKEAEKHYRDIFDGALEGIYRTSPDGRMLATNRALAKMLRYETPEEVVSTINDLARQIWVDPNERLRFAALQEEHGSIRGFECQVKCKDASLIWLSVDGRKVCGPDGNTLYYDGFVKDITDQKLVQEALRSSEARFATAFRSNPAITFLFRPDQDGNRYLDVNEAFERATGYRREEVIGRTSLELSLWYDAGEEAAGLRELYATGRIRNLEAHLRTKLGDDLIGLLSAQWIELDGQPWAIATIIDITEQKKAQAAAQKAHEAIAKAERNYRLLFNSITDAVFIHKVGENGLLSTFVEVNDAACRYLGYTREELLRMGPDDIDAPEEHIATPARALSIIADGHLMWEGMHISNHGRRIPVEINTHLVDVEGEQTIISCVRDISDRKEAEKNYRRIFDGALEGIFRTSLDGRALLANSALATMLGYGSAEEYLAQMKDSAHQIWMDPNERSKYLAVFEQQEIIRGYECQLKRRDGEGVWVSLNSRRVCGVDGQLLYTEGFIEDITERKRMQDALRKSEETFAMAFLSNPAISMLFYLEAEGNRIADVNEAFEQVTGYRREEVVGRMSKHFALWVDPGKFDEYRTLLQTDGRVRNLEFRFYTKTGEIRTGLMFSESLALEGKACVISTTIDITEQKKAEQARTTLVTAIEQASEAIVITDLAGTIQYCNPAFEKVTGYSKQEAIGQNSRVLKSGKHSPEFYEQLWDTITQGKVWSGHLINKKKDGSLFEEDATISPIRDTSGKLSGFVAVKHDVTERIQLEEQLRQAQKLESIGRLAGGVAHDFNNLLTVINGYSGFLLKRLKAGDPLRAHAEQITIAGERAASLTKQLLAFSRKQVIEPKVLDVNAIIRESTVMLRRLIGDDIVLETHLDGSLGQVMADPDQIHQVIMNLAVNARDAMPDGGALDIETLNVELTREDGAADHSERDPGRYVLMIVTDTGHGMDETIRKQIFEPFFTTKGVGKGTGLGLSTVYGIIRQNGGWIDVWSEVGVGTTFRIYLSRIDACPGAERKGISAPTEGGGETILLVEDQKEVRSFAKAALRQHGYPVLEASDGDEALSVAKQHLGQIDLLVTDVVMPGLNGKELSERLEELRPNLKVLFISGYTADVISNRGVLDPGVAFLHKPFGQEELARKVREVLAEPSKPIVGS
jgi:PAS domain S-box-containing protein